ncbi:homodimeric glycerol 3-phosphate dehydrogenase (quinone) [Pseudacidovorax intermedius]|uniref:Glycerol-3-phosphate dehydrogenase n=1 Tax=Pseudacidovorax intermedius TaxID=433924 RepID=A0A370FNW5_9BURK|nr:glycerol-3-phosphate dehydrogenase [Pseudacidovorax intermedius]RDI27504.1 homodimeric glycerol 3-phosphate dehydrogenase (quinone) [Pseudacidovorax intermedius]
MNGSENIRAASFELDPIQCDVLVVGGGINGCGIARDLAGRGFKVVLCEQDDLAAHTSSASTKLIHGGLRYLEYYEFSLVRKALAEREVLLKSAPHIMWPLRFVMPHDPAMRPAWMIRAGLFLYDHLAKREVLPGSRSVDLRRHPAGAPLKSRYKRGFVYSDGWVDDARLVVLNALDARARGAQILTGTRCVAARRGTEGWLCTLETADHAARAVQAKALVNAAGPWAEAFLRGAATPAGGESLAKRSLRLVQGSHIVVPRMFQHDHAYIFQNPDQRIIFAIPYQQDFTLIGTTDLELEGHDPRAGRITPGEIDYLCEQASRYFERAVTPADVVWTYSGVRPLLDDASGDPSAVTRDYLLERHIEAAPLLSVWGGKITTFRKLAEDAADAVGEMLNDRRPAWTETAPLAGGDLASWLPVESRRLPPDAQFERFVQEVQRRHPWLDAALARRWSRAYGTRIAQVLGDAAAMADLGAAVAPGVFERELRYLADEEWARTGDDVLWRRSKLGLHLDPSQREAVAAWMRRFAVTPSLSAAR